MSRRQPDRFTFVALVVGIVLGSVFSVRAGEADDDNKVHPLGEYQAVNDFAAVPPGTDRMQVIGKVVLIRDCVSADAREVDVVGTLDVERDAVTGTSPTRSAATEIVAMDLAGDDAVLGPVAVSESSTQESTGALTEIEGSPGFPVHSFFDVFVRIRVGDGPVLSNAVPRRVETTVYAIPPIEELYHSPAGAPSIALAGDPVDSWCLGKVEFAPTTPSQSVEKKELIELAAEVRAMRAEVQDIATFMTTTVARRDQRTVWKFIGTSRALRWQDLLLFSDVQQTVTATHRVPGTPCGQSRATISIPPQRVVKARFTGCNAPFSVIVRGTDPAGFLAAVVADEKDFLVVHPGDHD